MNANQNDRKENSRVYRHIGLVILLMALAACQWTSPARLTRTAVSPPVLATPTLEPDGPIQVYFTDPEDRAAGQQLETALIAGIHAAQESIDVAMYNFSHTGLADALADAARRGVAVRVVLDSEGIDAPVTRRFDQAGIGWLGDGQDSLMHNKFVVIDEREVWSGSLNFTRASLYRDYNNFVHIPSEALAMAYTAEFEEMFIRGVFSGGASTPQENIVDVEGVKVEVYFAPDDRPSRRITGLVRDAQSEIKFLAYAFTLDGLSQAMRVRERAGVSLMGVFDSDQSDATGGEYLAFRNQDLPVRLDGSDGLMHHKVIIIDGATVILGSFNFTRSADERNDENVLVVHDADIAHQFLSEFYLIYNASED